MLHVWVQEKLFHRGFFFCEKLFQRGTVYPVISAQKTVELPQNLQCPALGIALHIDRQDRVMHAQAQ